MRLNRCQAAAPGILLALTVLMMWLGKQHLLILENISVPSEGGTLAPFDTVIVKPPEGREFEIYEGESDSIMISGPYYTLEIGIPGEEGAPARSFRKKFYPGFADRVTVSLPQMVREQVREGSR